MTTGALMKKVIEKEEAGKDKKAEMEEMKKKKG